MQVYHPFNRITKDRSLGWILRNYDKIMSIEVMQPHGKSTGAMVRFNLADKSIAAVEFASVSVLEHFIFQQHKRIFSGLLVTWFNAHRRVI